MMIMMFFVFAACEKETVYQEQTNAIDQIDQEKDINETVDGKWGGEWCIYFIEYGRWQLTSSGLRCNDNLPGICSIRKFCIPKLVIDPCWLIPCWIDIFDPWIIYEKFDPRDFGSFRDKLELDIDPRITSVPFALNEQVMGLQFYEKNELMSIENRESGVFYLETDLVLDKETSENLGLQGNIVNAGKYPILINPENETFNVILSVEKGFKR